ncbi:MAG: WG repeat-containing protein [Planctomycetes bacterium]|nr:WG repeat-containing protein [Planctomycetota bacterium]
MTKRLITAAILPCVFIWGCDRSTVERPAHSADPPIEQASSNLRQFTRTLFPYHDGRAWGYMNREGKTVIAPEFGGPGDFFDDVAVTEKGGVKGLLNSSGEFLAVPEYDRIYRVSNGRARVAKRQNELKMFVGNFERFSFVGLDGKQISTEWFDVAGDFSEGLARVNQGARVFRGDVKGGKWGYINTSGKVAIELQFEDVGDFFEGLARAKKDGKWGFIDRTGSFQINPQYPYVGDFSEGLAAVDDVLLIRNSPLRDCRYIDQHGNVKIAGPFANGYEFSEGRAVVTDNGGPEGEMYYIDHDGKVVISLGLEIALEFSDGLACVWKDEKWGFIDRDGRWVMEPQFENRSEFVGGLASVDGRGGSWYIDKTNKRIRER